MAHPNNRHALRKLREINRTLLHLSLTAETVPECDASLDGIRQKVIVQIRRLDPASVADPAPEERDVAVFNMQAVGAGVLLTQRIAGATLGAS